MPLPAHEYIQHVARFLDAFDPCELAATPLLSSPPLARGLAKKALPGKKRLEREKAAADAAAKAQEAAAAAAAAPAEAQS